MSVAGLAIAGVGLVWGVFAIARSRTTEDPEIARGERRLGVIFVVSAVVVFALVVVAASQNGD